MTTHSHSDGHGHSFQARSLGVIAIVLAVSVLEISMGLLHHGTVLVQDAVHNAIDVIAYGLPVLSEHWAKREGHGIRRCYLAPQLSRLAGGLLVASASVFLLVGSLELQSEQPVESSGSLLLVALVALLANLLAQQVLHVEGHVEFDQNPATSRRHVIGDVGATSIVLLTTIALAASGWSEFDSIGTVAAAGLVIWFNLPSLLAKAPVSWHKRRNHPKGR